MFHVGFHVVVKGGIHRGSASRDTWPYRGVLSYKGSGKFRTPKKTLPDKSVVLAIDFYYSLFHLTSVSCALKHLH